ncbi:hypothetical protein HY030_02380 [Candidatus Gottesmanbacteria bacterium]|nr:hypothetical protein [Candidatus Gottesmanbacteria bacterium]
MGSLTETAYYTRKSINVGIIALVILLLLKVAFGYLYELWLALNPPPPPPPTVAFKVLPQINFPESTSSSSLVYSLETISGKFPKLPKIGKVYFIPIPSENLQSSQRAKEEAVLLGFSTQPQVITKTLWQWTDSVNFLRTLRFNIATGNFVLKYDWSNDTSIFNGKELPDENAAKTEAKNIFNNLEILPKELQNGRQVVSFYKAIVGKMTPAPSLSSADFVRIDYLRDDIDNIPLLGDTPSVSPVFLVFSGVREEKKRILELHFVYWGIDKETFATYPLRPVEEAWNDLNANLGYIANPGTTGSNLVNVRKIYLAYYYSDNPTNFLQPIYVFEADKGFIAYVSAISKEWLKEARNLPQ